MWVSRKSRTEKRIDLLEPIPVIYKLWIADEYALAKLIALTWRQRNHPDAILKLEDGTIEKIDYYRVDTDVYLDYGDGMKTIKEIMKLKKERDNFLEVYNNITEKLWEKVPKLNASEIIEEYERKGEKE